MYISHSNGPRYVRLHVALSSNQNFQAPSNPYFPEYIGDILLSGDNVNVVSDSMALSSVLGIAKFQGDVVGSDPFSTSRPSNTPYDSIYDWQNYGSIFSTFQTFHRYDDGPNEKNVLHTRYGGFLRDIDTTSDLYDYSSGFGLTLNGFFLPRWNGSAAYTGTLDTATGVDINDGGFLTFDLSNTQGVGPPAYDYLTWLDWTTQRVNAGVIIFSPASGWTYGYSNMVNSSYMRGNTLFIVCQYDLYIGYGLDLLSCRYHVNVDCEVSFVSVFGSKNPFDTNFIHPDCVKIIDRSTVSYFDLHGDGIATPTISPWRLKRANYTNSDIGIFSTGHQSVSGNRLSNFEHFRSSKGGDVHSYHRSYTAFIRKNFGDIQPAGFYAASDALDTAIEILKANHLENLTQLSGLLQILPTLPRLPNLIAKAVGGDPSVILDIIDYLTQAVLKFKFDQKPTVEDAVEIATTDVVGDLRKLLQTHSDTTYGKFIWVKPDGVPFWGDGRVVLVTRSKLRFHLDISTLLADIFTANATGLLPSLSRLWDLVPFSFVVDWFANEGDRLHAIDNQLLFAAVGVQWTLYSYKVFYYPSDSELASFGLETISADPFYIVVYVREKSLFVPRLRDSRFDFLAAKKPNLLTVGSFVWQALRKS